MPTALRTGPGQAEAAGGSL